MLNNFVSERLFSSGNYTKFGDLYGRLGISGGASQSEIKEAYYKLSKEHHPDMNEGCELSASNFRRVTEAYEILGNVTSRAQYDRGKILSLICALLNVVNAI